MHRFGLALSFAVALTAVALGCAKKDEECRKQVADLDQRLQRLEKFLAPHMNQPPPPPEPDPKVVYSVPIEGSPHKGPDHAKVTIVEAFEFA